MPPFAQVRSQEFDFEHFINRVFTRFIDIFLKEMIAAFSHLKFQSVFDIFEPRKLPHSVSEISSYGNNETKTLIDYYGKGKASTCKSVTINKMGILMDIEEWQGFWSEVYFGKSQSRGRKVSNETKELQEQERKRHYFRNFF